MSEIKIRKIKNYSVKVISSKSESGLSSADTEMDARATQAVKAAIQKAKICRKPVAQYDTVSKRTYVEYPNGVKRYVK